MVLISAVPTLGTEADMDMVAECKPKASPMLSIKVEVEEEAVTPQLAPGAELVEQDLDNLHEVPADVSAIATPMLDKILALGAVAHHVVSESTGCTLPPLDMPMTTRTPCSAIVPQSIEELPQSSGPTATGIATPSFVTPQCQPAPTTVPCRAVVSPVSSLESTVAITNHVIRTAASGKASPLRAGLRAGSGHPRRRLLWAGQMATLWRDRVNHTVEKEVSEDDEFATNMNGSFDEKCDLLMDEWRVLQAIGEHPNIVRALRIEETPRAVKIVLEDLLEQGYKPLYQMVEEDPALTARDIIAVVRDISSALVCIHAANISHGDLNVNNIMVQRDRETSAVRSTKVVDFNAAIHLSTSASPLLWVGAESISPPESDAQQAIKLLSGYPQDYKAPEKLTGAADMYSVGRLIWMMAARSLDTSSDLRLRQLDHYDFRGETDPLLAFANNDGQRTYGPLALLQHQLVSLDPSDRPTPSDVLEALQAMQTA